MKKSVKKAKPKRAETTTLYYNAGAGRLSGREIKAKKRLDALVEKYVAEGMSKKDATERGRKEMRDNPRGDWRAG
jgi:hypothetical protein